MSTFVLLRSERGTTAVVSTNSVKYVDLIDHGYQEVFEGTRKECKDQEENYREAFDEAFTEFAD